MVATALQPHVPGTSRTSTTASSANATQHSTLEMLGTQPTAAEQQRVSDLQQQFQQQAQKDPAGFRLALREAFGDKASPAQIDQLLDLALAGKLPMPSNIQFVEAGSLGSGALGAYDASNGGSLYLDRSLLSDPSKLQSVFNEEMGHHLDALLGGADAAGDEGAVFSRTLEQGPLSAQELTALKGENDQGVIQIEGRWVQVEFHENGSEDSGSENSDGDDSGGSESSSSDSADSSGAECSVDSGGGTSGGSTGSESAGDNSDTGDTGGECSVGGDNDGGDTEGADEPDDTDNTPEDYGNRDSDSDKAAGTQGADPTGGPPGSNGTPSGDDVLGDDDTSEAENGTTPGDDEETQTETEPAPEPEPEKKGFWSRTMDAVQMGLDVAGFVPGLGAIPDLANAGIHLARGNKAEAAISAAAAIPGAGDAFKAGAMGVKAADRLNDGRRALDKVEDVAASGNKIPNSELLGPPNKRGNAPKGNDGHPVELHHRNQKPDGPLDEMTRTDHRLGDNFSKNHTNTGQAPSQIDRKEWRNEQKNYWRNEWDDGRFDDM